MSMLSVDVVCIHTVPIWSGVGDSLDVESRLVRIKADLMCELIGVR